MTKRNRRSLRRRTDRKPKVRVRWVRSPIKGPRGRRLRVLIYARYSSDEQRKRSIKAQVEYCKKSLQALKVKDAKIEVLFDEAKSGELRSRPGIDQVWAGIRAGKWDLIIVEDCGRLYRDEVLCVDIVRLAVDQDIRTICLNDMVDTCEPDWEQRLKEASRHHEDSNRYLSPRIKRAHEELWDDGAAIVLLKPGYRRKPSLPATDDEPEEGPFFDEVDPTWTPVIKEAYERIAAGESPWSVADWLTEVGLPKTENFQKDTWSGRNVVSFIRFTDYRGFQTYRDCVSKKEYSTGKRKPTPNDPDEVLSREMPELRIVDDALWYAANEAIDKRNRHGDQPSGKENPQYGIPRDSRGPLSGVFLCRCGAKMQMDGRGKGAYRCGQAKDGDCWNKATALRDETHEWLFGAIRQQLESLDGELDNLVANATNLLDYDGCQESQRTDLERRRAKLEESQERLMSAIELSKRPLETLVAKLEKCEAGLDIVNARLERLQRREILCVPPSRAEVDEGVCKMVSTLRQMDRTVRDDLKRLVGEIRAVPHQQFDSAKVVLRARFEIRLFALLPVKTRAALTSVLGHSVADLFAKVPLTVDLFDPSTGPKYGLKAVELMNKCGRHPTRIGRELGITKRQACIALDYGNALIAAGMTDPYIELTEPPSNASRWRLDRYRKKHPGDAAEPTAPVV